jgi:hypothetical protein
MVLLKQLLLPVEVQVEQMDQLAQVMVAVVLVVYYLSQV